MRYRVSVRVEGEVFLGRGVDRLEASRDGLAFELRGEGRGNRVTEASISRSVPPDRLERFRSTVAPGTGDIKLSVNIGGDKELFDALLLELQRFEAAFCFGVRGALKRFVWHSYKTDFIPETPEDEAMLAIGSYEFKNAYPSPEWLLKPGGLTRLLTDPSFESLAIPRAFWQDGNREFEQHRYIQAFYNFYFILEDFYGDGEFTKAGTLWAFRKSTEFHKITEFGLELIRRTPKHVAALEALATEYSCGPLDGIEAAWKLLFAIRGQLHHYSSKDRRVRGTPFTHKEFLAPALFALYLASSAVETKELAGWRQAAHASRMQSERPRTTQPDNT